MSKLRDLILRIVQGELQRKIKEVDAWDGKASNYKDTDSYCRACLIDVNTGDTKDQSHCMLPVREDGDSAGTFVKQAVYAASGGRGITQVKKPADVSQDDWDAAKVKAANDLIRAYDQMGEVAPESVYGIAGKERPDEMGEDEDMMDEEEKDACAPKEKRVSTMGDIYGKVCKVAEGMEGYPWIIDLYQDGPQMFAVLAMGGKLYRANIVIGQDESVTMGEMIEVKMDFPPVTSRTFIKRQADGRVRWVGVSCSSVLNRNGQIDSTKLFDSFVEHAEKTGEYPIRNFFHQGDVFRIGQADFLARDGNLLLTSGLYDDTEIARREIAAREKNPDVWGDSIEFYAESPEIIEVGGVEIPVYEKGIIRYISTLPESEACAWMTAAPSIYTEEVNRMLDKRAMEAFVLLFDGDEDEAKKWLEKNADARNRAIQDAGMITRSTEPAAETPAPVAEPVAQEQKLEPRVVEFDDAALQALVERVSVSIGETLAPQFQGINDQYRMAQDSLAAAAQRLDEIEKRIAALEKPVETVIEEALQDTPAAVRAKFVPVYRPTQQTNGKGNGEEQPPTYAELAAQRMRAIEEKYKKGGIQNG